MPWEPAPSIAEQIIAQGGDYALALKDHHQDLCTEVKASFALAEKDPRTTLSTLRTVDGGHGRLSIRPYQTISDPALLAYRDPYHRWPGLQGTARLKPERPIRAQVSLKSPPSPS